MPEATGKQILDLPMGVNDADAQTVGDYLKALLERVWEEQEGFSGKRPFGNSGWAWELRAAVAAGGLASPDDRDAADRLIVEAIRAL